MSSPDRPVPCRDPVETEERPNYAPGVDGFDEVTGIEFPEDAEADFVPLQTEEEAERQARRDRDPFQSDSLKAQEAFDSAAAAAAAGDEERAVQEYLRAAKIAESAREWYLAAVACQQVADFLLSPDPPCDLERAFRMYRRAIAAYEQCGLFAEARELAYRQMYIKMRRGAELGLRLSQRMELWLHWRIAGFGFRPLRVIGTAAVLVLGFGVLFWAINGVHHTAGTERVDLWQSIYFSGITFATVGYGDFVPAEGARFLALVEGFIGAFTMGLFVAVLANRLSKS